MSWYAFTCAYSGVLCAPSMMLHSSIPGAGRMPTLWVRSNSWRQAGRKLAEPLVAIFSFALFKIVVAIVSSADMMLGSGDSGFGEAARSREYALMTRQALDDSRGADSHKGKEPRAVKSREAETLILISSTSPIQNWRKLMETRT